MVWGSGGNGGGWKSGEGGPWGKPRQSGGGGGNHGGAPGRDPGEGPDFEALLQRWQDRMRDWFGGGIDHPRSVALIAAAGLFLWLLSGVYIVESDEQGVVLRFGAFHRIAEPGPNYHLPYPVETVETPKVTTINRTEVGMRSVGGQRDDSSILEESLMLTGDENIIDVNFEVQWKISDAAAYLFNVRGPQGAVKAAAESAMREVVGRTPVGTILSGNEGRSQIESEVQRGVQQMLDAYKAGILVTKVNMLKAEPPSQVIESFRDVQRAQTDQERARNQAEAYRNDIIPRARGAAVQIVQEAEAYRDQVVANAEGEAARFVSVYGQYKQARDVTRKRMYLETMEQILQGMNKMVMDQKSGGVLPYLPLPELKSKNTEEAK